MITENLIKKIFIVFSCVVLFLTTSCKKDKNNEVLPIKESGNIAIKVQWMLS